MAQTVTGTARAADGCLLSYQIAPSPGTPRLVLIHSLGLSRTIWNAIVTELDGDWRARAAKAAEVGFSSMVSFQTGRWFSDGFREAHPERTEEIIRIFLDNEIRCYQAACEMLGHADLGDAARALRLPVSVIVCEEDQATPIAMSESLHDMIPDSTLTMIPGGRHLTPVQCPTDIAALLRNLAGSQT